MDDWMGLTTYYFEGFGLAFRGLADTLKRLVVIGSTEVEGE